MASTSSALPETVREKSLPPQLMDTFLGLSSSMISMPSFSATLSSPTRLAIFLTEPKPGLSPMIGVAPASRTISATVSITTGCVMIHFLGLLSLKKFGFRRTFDPFLIMFSIPPKKENVLFIALRMSSLE